MAAIEPDLDTDTPIVFPIVPSSTCAYCEGRRRVWGHSGGVEFLFDCVCAGGSETAVRWLLGLPTQ